MRRKGVNTINHLYAGVLYPSEDQCVMPTKSSPALRKASDFKILWERSVGFMTVWIVHLGRRFHLVQTLATLDSPQKPEILAKLCSLDPPTVATWCAAAHSHRILQQSNGGYLLPKRLRPLIAFEDHPDYIAGQFSYLALRSLDYDAFDSLFRHGLVDKTAAHIVEAFAEATKWDHTMFQKVILPLFPGLHRMMKAGGRILDLGCGSGEWDLRMAPVFSKCVFLGVDPNKRAISLARQKARHAGLDNRVSFLGGAAESIDFSGSFDIVYLGEVLYAIGAKADVLRKCFRALKQSGFLIIAEGLSERGDRPHSLTNQLIHGMELDFALQGTRFLSESELRVLLRNSGFAKPRFVHANGGLWFIVAQK